MPVISSDFVNEAFQSVISHDAKSIYASSSRLFKHAVFGRDSLEVAEDIISFKPELVRQVLLGLASKQGERLVVSNEEEPGKIMHEYRRLSISGQPLDAASQIIFKELSRKWGGNSNELVYYGSVDSTPLFVRLVGTYCRLYGHELLSEKVTLHSGRVRNVAEVTQSAANWICEKLPNFPLPLLSYKRLNLKGIENQAWKDATEFYVHSDGQLANLNQPIVSVEVQGIAYDALLAAAELFPDSASRYLKIAQQIQLATLEHLWMPQAKYFALGMDIHDGNPKQLEVVTANPSELLNSRLFDDLKPSLRKLFIGNIVEIMCSSNFVTNGGIRSRALSDANVVNFIDYHGSYTTWPKETYDFVKGLKRQGFPRLAEQFENRLMNVTAAAICYPEFVYVDASGRLFFGSESSQSDRTAHIITSSNKPEEVQAWTVSAILGILNDKTEYPRIDPTNWRYKLEAKLLKQMPNIPLIDSAVALTKHYPHYSYRIVKHSIESSFWHFLQNDATD
jgi:glycogen debranching enzyme